jgi:hypothetical protein
MTRTTSPTPVRAGTQGHSHSVEDLIKKLGGNAMPESSDVVVERRAVSAEDEPGSDPYNHTGRFHRIFK